MKKKGAISNTSPKRPPTNKEKILKIIRLKTVSYLSLPGEGLFSHYY